MGHEVADANFMGEHKIDWYKEDACYASGDQATALGEYGKMRDALNKTGYSEYNSKYNIAQLSFFKMAPNTLGCWV